MNPPSPSHNKIFVPINLLQIHRELHSTADHETQGLDDDLNKNPTEQNNFIETKHTVREKEIKDEPMVYKESENKYVANINIKTTDLANVNNETLTNEDKHIHKERERLINFNMREGNIKIEPMSYKELKSNHVPKINIRNLDLNDTNKVTLTGDDNDTHEERKKVTNYNVDAHMIEDDRRNWVEIEIKTEQADHEESAGDDNDIHEEREKVTNYNVDAHMIEDDRRNWVEIEIKTEEADHEESAGAAPAEKYKRTHAGKIQDGSTLTPGTKNILKKPRTRSTVVEEATSRNIGRYVLQGTKTATNRQVSINSYPDTAIYKSNISIGSDNDDCGNVFDEKHRIERIVTVKKTSHPKSSQQRTISHEQKINRTSVVDEQTGTHSGKKLFECHICKVTFTQKGRLKDHLRIHTGEKPYTCDICKVRFTRKSSQKKHLRIHTGEKPFECEICKVTFTLKSNLKKHLRVHSGEKPYECDLCNVRFSEKHHLKNHLGIHTGEKPYKCDTCKIRFTRKSSLKKHLRIHCGKKRYKSSSSTCI